jgi:hypothetical protein
MRKSNLFFPVLLFLVIYHGGYAQQLTGSAGSTATNSSAVLSWSIGEPVTGSATSATRAMTIGFQQPAPIIITSIFDDPETQFNVFPNPARDMIFVQRPQSSTNVRVKLYDVNGKNLYEADFAIDKTELQIITENLTAGVYILRGFTGDRLVFERKLVKL